MVTGFIFFLQLLKIDLRQELIHIGLRDSLNWDFPFGLSLKLLQA